MHKLFSFLNILFFLLFLPLTSSLLFLSFYVSMVILHTPINTLDCFSLFFFSSCISSLITTSSPLTVHQLEQCKQACWVFVSQKLPFCIRSYVLRGYFSLANRSFVVFFSCCSTLFFALKLFFFHTPTRKKHAEIRHDDFFY